MNWQFTDDRPIWQQITEQLTLRILRGEYPPGERLPGVRELAAQAGVNPNTMQRALAQLETDGLALGSRTAGRTVSACADRRIGMSPHSGGAGLLRRGSPCACKGGITP